MNVKLLEWVLRIGVAGEFIGHGVFAMQGKKDWIGWFANFGVSDAVFAAKMLFWIGVADIVLGILVLIKPMRLPLLWMTFWGFWTALLRPLVGLPVWDFVERWANWSAPLALLLLIGWPKDWRDWFRF